MSESHFTQSAMNLGFVGNMATPTGGHILAARAGNKPT